MDSLPFGLFAATSSRPLAPVLMNARLLSISLGSTLTVLMFTGCGVPSAQMVFDPVAVPLAVPTLSATALA